MLIGLSPPRHRVRVTARVDIEVPVDELKSWFAAARDAEADSFVIAIYDDDSMDYWRGGIRVIPTQPCRAGRWLRR